MLSDVFAFAEGVLGCTKAIATADELLKIELVRAYVCEWLSYIFTDLLRFS